MRAFGDGNVDVLCGAANGNTCSDLSFGRRFFVTRSGRGERRCEEWCIQGKHVEEVFFVGEGRGHVYALAEKIKIRIYMRKFNNLMAMHRVIIYIANGVDINGVVEFIVMNGRRRINRCRCSRSIDFCVRVYFTRVVTT